MNNFDEILSDLDKQDATYSTIFDFAVIKEVRNSIVDVLSMSRNNLYKDCLLLGNFIPAVNSKGVLFFVDNARYPCFYPIEGQLNYVAGTTSFEHTTISSVNYGTTEANKKYIIQVARNQFGVKDVWLAYIMATAEQEAGYDFIPKSEIGGEKKEYNPWYGRGLIQLTLEGNYRLWSTITGVDLINNKELAKDIKVATFILCKWLVEGPSANGKTLSDYMPNRNENPTLEEYKGCRAMVNPKEYNSYITVAQRAMRWFQELKTNYKP